MSGDKIVADTSLLVNFFNGVEISRKVVSGRHIWISSITEIELLSYRDLDESESTLIKEFINDCVLTELTKPIRDGAIRLRKNFGLKVPDAIIAATSLHLDFPLVTMDRDFENVEEIDVIILEY